MAYNYSVIITNHSSHSDYFMLYQDDPTSWAPNALAIAWFSKYSNPGANVTVKFTWTLDWGFSWADVGKLTPGVLFEATDQVPIKGSQDNQITLDYNGAYRFMSQQAGADPNRFYLAESATIPVNSPASVGITLGGKTVYAAQARPNTNLTFSPHVSYYLAYGNYAPGDVLDVSSINNPLKLEFGTGVYSLHTTLNANDSWTPPTPTAKINARLIEERTRNPKASWTDF